MSVKISRVWQPGYKERELIVRNQIPINEQPAPGNVIFIINYRIKSNFQRSPSFLIVMLIYQLWSFRYISG